MNSSLVPIPVSAEKVSSVSASAEAKERLEIDPYPELG